MPNVLQQYTNKVRIFFRDFAAKNELLEDSEGNPRQENTNDEIKFAIESVYLDSCQAPPKVWVKPLSELQNKLWFMWGVCAFLLDSNTFLNARNTLPMQDGGVEINPEGYKVTMYSQAAINLWAKYDAGLIKDKIRYNYESFYADSNVGTDRESQYLFVNGIYY